MSDTIPPAAGSPVPPPPQTTAQKFGRWAMIGAGIIIGLGGLAKLIGTFTLPPCDSTRTSDTLRSIFQERKIEINRISDLKTVTSSFSEYTCTAQVDAPGEQANLNYRIYWEGWSARVIITEVQAKPR